jgi:hypothetical protein
MDLLAQTDERALGALLGKIVIAFAVIAFVAQRIYRAAIKK